MNLKNSQYQAIMRQYDLRQLQHRHLQSQRYQESAIVCLPTGSWKKKPPLSVQTEPGCCPGPEGCSAGYAAASAGTAGAENASADTGRVSC